MNPFERFKQKQTRVTRAARKGVSSPFGACLDPSTTATVPATMPPAVPGLRLRRRNGKSRGSTQYYAWTGWVDGKRREIYLGSVKKISLSEARLRAAQCRDRARAEGQTVKTRPKTKTGPQLHRPWDRILEVSLRYVLAGRLLDGRGLTFAQRLYDYLQDVAMMRMANRRRRRQTSTPATDDAGIASSVNMEKKIS